jgi:hypothetical protein
MRTNITAAFFMLSALTLSTTAMADGIVTTREIIQDKRTKPARTCQRTGAIPVRLGAIGVRRTPLFQVPTFTTQVEPLTGLELRPEAWLDPTVEQAGSQPVDWWTHATPALRLRAQSGDVLFHAFFPPGPATVATINNAEQLGRIQEIRPRNKVAIVNHIWLLVSGQALRMHQEAGATEAELTELALSTGTTVGYCSSRIQWEKDRTVGALKAKY